MPPPSVKAASRRILRGIVVSALFAPLLGSGLAAQEAAVPVPPPMPPGRPADLGAAPSPPAGPSLDAPRPPERPPELSAPAVKPPDPKPEAPAAEATPLPPARPAELSGEAALALTVAAADDTACRQRLERLGARFEPQPALSDGQCGAARPLKVTALAGDLALTPPAILVCGAAEALARWATEAQVLAERDLSQPLKGLSLGTTYVCRGQNHDPDAKLSEHAFANGIDVMGFAFASRPAITVAPLPEGTPEAAFLAHARAKACGFFRTVLGPGTDAAHANHFHLDERERPAGHRLCQ
ncbi:extensin family protein [Methylobacterium sp. J-090]|uniref:extensin-like domain-containing protein n=1 Tax=Methylobacterium sp. J-090 TaxID=2836666 RepID=UPI001FBB7D5A|nr:extensin family protein [Methylobacterium sp. J-090]MCJ2082137.1 extensin family protein [Methylobacterium sp. J-090]